MWLTGEVKRHHRTEKMLLRLVRKGKLVAKNDGRKVIYTVPRRKNNRDVRHGLACTEALVRFYRSKEGIVIPEHKFTRQQNGVVPEWGIKYPGGMMVLFEFCTYDNFKRGAVKSKVKRYLKNLYNIESKFQAEAFVVFVIDIDNWAVQDFVLKNMPIGEQFFFTGYDNFLKSPIGEQLDTSIYIWGEDGNKYPLRRKDA